MEQQFAQAVLRRLPLAEATLHLWRVIGDGDTLEDLFERHRGACYTGQLTFPVLTHLVADALLEHQGSARKSFARGRENEELPVSIVAAYGKLRRVRVRELYGRLDPVSQNAVRVATFDPAGYLDRNKFLAWFGELPRFKETDPKLKLMSVSNYHDDRSKPCLLQLFFPRFDHLLPDTREILCTFVPPPEPFSIRTVDAPPKTQIFQGHIWDGKKSVAKNWEEPVCVRETAEAAGADFQSLLRLIQAGKVRVTDKKLVPTEATRKVVAGVLTGGDFYAPDDASEDKWDPAFDIGIRSFAWPVLVLAGGLAEKSGETLKLTVAGKKALTSSPTDAILKLWKAWIKTREYDEFARVDAIKGQGPARMSAAAGRRAVIVEGLAACPVGRWFAIDDFFRFLRATGRSFSIAHSEHVLYIAERNYGSLGYIDGQSWEQIQGRYTLAFLFEYVATLGIIDVAYVKPQGVRNDFYGRWGTDDFSCLSRYDGLLHIRVNPFGAWVLGVADDYRPATPTPSGVLKVLANHDLVTTHGLPASDRLVLDRFANQTSEGVWKLSAIKVLGVIEQGGSIDELQQFLSSRTTGELPRTVNTFIVDLRAKASRLTDAGAARLIECTDEHIATELANERQLRGKCLRAGERFVVVRDADLDAVRKVVRKLGYVWPVTGD